MTLPATVPAGGPSEDPESLSPDDGLGGADSSPAPPTNVVSEALVVGAEEVELEALQVAVLEVVPTEEDLEKDDKLDEDVDKVVNGEELLGDPEPEDVNERTETEF